MATTSPNLPEARPQAAPPTSWFNTRRGRVVIENLTAYLFLLPAGMLIFLFGIFPVGFAFYVSLNRWRRFPESYEGLGNYTRSLGDFAYVLFFWLAIGALIYAAVLLVRFWRERGFGRTWLLLVPAVLNVGALLLFTRWFFMLLPVVLDIPQRVRGQERVPGLFVNELFASFRVAEVSDAGNLALLSILAASVASVIFLRFIRSDDSARALIDLMLAAFFVAAGVLVIQLTATAISATIEAARGEGTELPIWSQVILISGGFTLVAAAFVLWRKAIAQHDGRHFALLGAAALALLVGGYLLVAELPQALANADETLLHSFGITVMFVIGTVPLQLAAGLGLAYLLFQNIKGKSFFRIVYFLPYITPFVATSVVFKILFSHRETSPINQFFGFLGIPPQAWLLQPTGIFELIFGPNIPDWLAGPSLALVVIMLYTVWTYIGYDTVVFLAGLGNISMELYEAARIDGASSWAIFRYITLPLLSPTTFFLSLIAIIGTFKAFTQVWIMRFPASANSVDTTSVYIFETVRANTNLGYGSAMAFVLFGIILALTVFQNRLMGRKVFYG
ncbi:MAG: sugar ABC transporter permease [Burkholderiales bacterium]|nr:sugar ABC transporter permease [Anaerolineae bacterium]